MLATSQGKPCIPLCLPQSMGAQSLAVSRSVGRSVGRSVSRSEALALLRCSLFFSDGSNVVFCFNSFTVFVSFIVSFLKSFPDL